MHSTLVLASQNEKSRRRHQGCKLQHIRALLKGVLCVRYFCSPKGSSKVRNARKATRDYWWSVRGIAQHFIKGSTQIRAEPQQLLDYCWYTTPTGFVRPNQPNTYSCSLFVEHRHSYFLKWLSCKQIGEMESDRPKPPHHPIPSVMPEDETVLRFGYATLALAPSCRRYGSTPAVHR